MTFSKEELENKSDLELVSMARKKGKWNWCMSKPIEFGSLLGETETISNIQKLQQCLENGANKLKDIIENHRLSQEDEVVIDKQTNKISILMLALPETKQERDRLIETLLETDS